jgi:16S rRNA processing protein RimM
LRFVTAGRVGKPHGRDGSFWVDDATQRFALGSVVVLASGTHTVERRSGSDQRPLIRLGGVADPRHLRGELLLVEDELREHEWLACELEGAAVRGHGRVVRVIDAPSCSVLELEDGTLVPFIGDAIRSVGEREIVLNEDFLG